jgi:hypothetical protein
MMNFSRDNLDQEPLTNLIKYLKPDKNKFLRTFSKWTENKLPFTVEKKNNWRKFQSNLFIYSVCHDLKRDNNIHVQ